MRTASELERQSREKAGAGKRKNDDKGKPRLQFLYILAFLLLVARAVCASNLVPTAFLTNKDLELH